MTYVNSKIVKLCECGCGNPVKLASKTKASMGHVKGEPLRFIHGHSQCGSRNSHYKGDDVWASNNSGKHFCQCPDCRAKGDCAETMIAITRDHHWRGLPKLKPGHYEPSDFRVAGQDSEETKMKRAESIRRAWATDPEYRRKVTEAARKNCKNWHKKFNRRPTGPEVLLSSLLPRGIRYVGGGDFYIWIPFLQRRRNPDYKVTGQKKVIELFGDYWHRNEDPADIIGQYAEAGFECLVVWEGELNADPVAVQQRCVKFAEGG